MNITKNILTKNPCYNAGKTIKVKGIMLHSVGCSQPSAMAFIKSWNAADAKVCVHGFIDGNTGGVYQTLPWNRRGWHCGGNANGTHIGIEMCEPDCIKYTSGSKFICSDVDKATAIVKRTYKAAVELFAYLCNEYGLNPLAEGVILSHSEGYSKGLASNHADPEHLWEGLKLPYTMDGFRADVKATMNPSKYKVQVGSFSNKKNAENLLTKLKKAGFEGFIITN